MLGQAMSSPVTVNVPVAVAFVCHRSAVSCGPLMVAVYTSAVGLDRIVIVARRDRETDGQ